MASRDVIGRRISRNEGLGDFVPCTFPTPHQYLSTGIITPVINYRYECTYCRSMSADFEKNCRNCGAPLSAQKLLR